MVHCFLQTHSATEVVYINICIILEMQIKFNVKLQKLPKRYIIADTSYILNPADLFIKLGDIRKTRHTFKCEI